MVILVPAFAKVNLMLRITGKTESGYHNLQSIFVFLKDVYDDIIINSDREFGKSSGIIDGVCDASNSVKLAAEILHDIFHLKIPHVDIKKRIPMGSGLGGGSSDAARFIDAVFDIWQMPHQERLAYINFFNPLGTDAALFLFGFFMKTDPILLDGTIFPRAIPELNGRYIVVVHNGIFLSTGRVYSEFTGPFQAAIDINTCDLEYLSKNFHNSLQETAISLVPEIREILSSIEKTNPLFHGVSGSGSSCFGLYDSRDMAEEAVTSLKLLGYDFVRMSRI
ncbi:MAG: hypothetical protein LBJ77_00640 [Holosporales bacterium]|nr:hypothetical protein [Holosporales bacterium]